MKKIIIIGSGMGGMAAGIYGQLNGFDTIIFEAHSQPGGQCTSWKRKGYVFDGCMHHFGGGSPQTKVEAFWQELGVQPCEKVEVNELISAVFPDGTSFHDYCDLEKLESHLKQLSPEDADIIDEYINGIRLFQKKDTIGDLMLGSLGEKFSSLPAFFRLLKYFKYTLGSFAKRFKHPVLQKAFPLLHYSCPEFPLFGQLCKEANIAKGGIAWPRGGSLTVSGNLAARYIELGGTIHYCKKVVKILTDNNHACGVELEDVTQHKADFVVSNADGRKTIMQMLEGRYINKKIARYCEPNPDKDLEWSVMVFLGVKRDLSAYPPALIMFLDKPVDICGYTCNHLDLQTYGFDTSMAPAGKSVIKVELFSKISYFSRLYNDKEAYQSEKNKIAEQVITLLEKQLPGIRQDIEVIDVVTLHTWERYMGGSQGWFNWPNKKFSIPGDVFGLDNRFTLPRLKNFYLAGQWATSAGALLLNAISGKTVVQKICKQCGIKFKKSR